MKQQIETALRAFSGPDLRDDVWRDFEPVAHSPEDILLIFTRSMNLSWLAKHALDFELITWLVIKSGGTDG